MLEAVFYPVGKGAVPVVYVKMIRCDKVVRYVEVGPAVVVDISCSDTQSIATFANARLNTDIGEHGVPKCFIRVVLKQFVNIFFGAVLTVPNV